MVRVERTKQRLAGMKLVSLGLFEWNCNSIKDLLTFFPEWGPREWQKKTSLARTISALFDFSIGQ